MSTVQVLGFLSRFRFRFYSRLSDSFLSRFHSCLNFLLVSVSFWSWFSDSFRSQFPPNLGFIPNSRIHSQSVCHVYSFLRFPDSFGSEILRSLEDSFPILTGICLYSRSCIQFLELSVFCPHSRGFSTHLIVWCSNLSMIVFPSLGLHSPTHLWSVLILEVCRFIRFQDAPIFQGFVSYS